MARVGVPPPARRGGDLAAGGLLPSQRDHSQPTIRLGALEAPSRNWPGEIVCGDVIENPRECDANRIARGWHAVHLKGNRHVRGDGPGKEYLEDLAHLTPPYSPQCDDHKNLP